MSHVCAPQKSYSHFVPRLGYDRQEAFTFHLSYRFLVRNFVESLDTSVGLGLSSLMMLETMHEHRHMDNTEFPARRIQFPPTRV